MGLINIVSDVYRIFTAIAIATSVVVRCVRSHMDIMSEHLQYEILAWFMVQMRCKKYVVTMNYSANSVTWKTSAKTLEAGYPKREHLYF